MLERLLLIGTDFNALDRDGRVKASLRFAATPEVPAVGEWVSLMDAESNSCLARVEVVDGLAVVARPDWATWIPGAIAQLNQVFRSSVYADDVRAHPPTSTRGEPLPT
jgi:hypothetical protein